MSITVYLIFNVVHNYFQKKQLLSADIIVKELFIENAKLTSMIHGLQTQIERSSSYNSV